MVRSREKELILTNPVSTALLLDQGEFQIIATVNDNVLGAVMAGLIIVHKNTSIQNLSDLTNKKIGVVNQKYAAGGYLFQAIEIAIAGLDPKQILTNVIELFNQRAIIRRVNLMQLDAGFIRTGMLTSLNGKEATNNIRVINKLGNDNIFRLSTPTYPNWAVLVRINISNELKNEITGE